MHFTEAAVLAVLTKGILYLEEDCGKITTAAAYSETKFMDMIKKRTFVPTPAEVIRNDWKVIWGKNSKTAARLAGRIEFQRKNGFPED